jgi:hypothetical protein
MFKENFGNHIRNTFNRYATKAAVLGTSHIIRKVLQPETLKHERWGSPLLQEEKYQEKKACDKRHDDAADDDAN